MIASDIDDADIKDMRKKIETLRTMNATEEQKYKCRCDFQQSQYDQLKK